MVIDAGPAIEILMAHRARIHAVVILLLLILLCILVHYLFLDMLIKKLPENLV